MKHKKLLTVLAFTLILALMLNACSLLYPAGKVKDLIDKIATEPTSEATEAPTEDATAPTEAPFVPTVERDAEPVFDPVSFGEMEYERPDSTRLCSDLAAVQTLVEEEKDLDTVLDAFYDTYDEYRVFDTMTTLAYIHYTLDLEDEFYTAENTWCDEQGPLVAQALEKCYIAMSQSPLRSALEEECFGEGFFEFYDENQVYSNDRVVELIQQDAALQTEYMALQSNRTIEWKGQERLFDEVVDEVGGDYGTYLSAYEAYYNKYNPLVADIFIRQIRVRKEIAQELGYDSYAEFAYEYTYRRDYTPEQVAQYTSDIAEEMSPLFYTAAYNSYTEEMDTDTSFRLLEDTAAVFGGEIEEAYRYMKEYGLFDLSKSSSKMPGSYMTYLSAYEMPFLYVSPTGTISDLLTEMHEFGHFVDGYVNCGNTTSIDCNEIFSQGLEFLSLNRAALTEDQREALTVSKVSEALTVFLGQGAYAAFELAVYDLPDAELTAENINQLFLECNERFGMGFTGLEAIIAPGWIDIQHFLIAPFYVISYCISNDAALQIYQTEAETGEGLALYRELLGLSADNTVLNLLDEAGMESPFAPGRIAELTDFLTEVMNG